MDSVKRIHVLVNPAASDNAGSKIWAALSEQFESLFAGFERIVSEPSSREQAVEIALDTDADLLISVSGDGALHNIAQAIVKRPRADRPALSVVPVGSGNDFAKTLGISKEPAQALQEIRDGQRLNIDIGLCNDTIFMETLSFGIDAAIAIGTEEKRKTSKLRGLALYANVAVSAIIRELKKHHFVIKLEDGTVIDRDLLICAVQNGPTYGGGFKVAPRAVVDDGLLDICLASETNRVFALYALALMSKGKHEDLKIFKAIKTKSLTIDINEDIFVQCDGECLRGRHFAVEVISQALDVIATPRAAVTVNTESAARATVLEAAAATTRIEDVAAAENIDKAAMSGKMEEAAATTELNGVDRQ